MSLLKQMMGIVMSLCIFGSLMSGCGVAEKDNSDVHITADKSLIRKLEDNPLIIGVRKALTEADKEKAKEAGKNMIDGHLIEMESYYNMIVLPNYSLRLHFEVRSKSDFQFTLYNLVEEGGNFTTYPTNGK